MQQNVSVFIYWHSIRLQQPNEANKMAKGNKRQYQSRPVDNTMGSLQGNEPREVIQIDLREIFKLCQNIMEDLLKRIEEENIVLKRKIN